MGVESEQPVEDPTIGIATAPSDKEKPKNSYALMINIQADYVRIMMEEGIDLPMGEDRAAPLITKV